MCFGATVQIFFFYSSTWKTFEKQLQDRQTHNPELYMYVRYVHVYCIIVLASSYITEQCMQHTKWVNLSGSQAVNLIFLYQSPALFFSFLITHHLSQPCWMPMACPDLPSHWLPPNSRVQGPNNLYLFNKSLKTVMLCSTLFFSPFSLPIPFSQRSC